MLHRGLCVGVDLPRSEPEAGPLLLKKKNNPNWRRITLLSFGFQRCDSKDWPVSAVKLVDVLAGESPASAVSQLAL